MVYKGVVVVKKYEILLIIISILVVVLGGILLVTYFSSSSVGNYTSEIGDTFTFGVKLVDDKVDGIYCNKSDKNHILKVNEDEAVFLLHSGYYKILDVSDDFEAIFYTPVFYDDVLFPESVPIYKSFMSELEEPNGDLVPVRYIPYMQYSGSEFNIVSAYGDSIATVEAVVRENFLVNRYSQMQVLSGKIELEKIGLIPKQNSKRDDRNSL